MGDPDVTLGWGHAGRCGDGEGGGAKAELRRLRPTRGFEKEEQMKHSIRESGHAKVTVPSKASWKAKLDSIKKEGMLAANAMRKRGHGFEVAVLAPREVVGEDTVPVSAVFLKLNWKLAMKREMVELARDFMSNAYICDALDPALPFILKSVIVEKGLYEHSVGEFFLRYGRFEQKYRLSKGSETRTKMLELTGGHLQYIKEYVERGTRRMDPLPYAVRNILSHVGNNPNRLDDDGNDLRVAIKLLKSWV